MASKDEIKTAIKPEQRAEKSYHSIDEFLDLSFEQLFEEPVYVVEDAQEGEEIAFGDEGLVISEERFLELEFEALFDQPVRIARRTLDEDENSSLESQVQSNRSTLDVRQVNFGNEGTEDSEFQVISIAQDFAPPPQITPTGNSEILATLTLSSNTSSVLSVDGIGGALQEDSANPIQTASGNLFVPDDNLFGLIPQGTGGVSFQIVTRPGSGQTIDEDGDLVTVTTPYGNTFVYNKVTFDYTYTLQAPIQHRDVGPSDDGNDDNDLINLPIWEPDDPALYDLPSELFPKSFNPQVTIDSNNDGIPTVKEIVDALFTDIGGVINYNAFGVPFSNTFPGLLGGVDYADLPFIPDDHNGLPGGPSLNIAKIDGVFVDEFNQADDDFDINRSFYDVVLIVTTNALNQSSIGFAIFKIIDDIPVLANDTNLVDETAFFVTGSQVVMGNLLDNDDLGFDGGQIISVNGASDADNDGFITFSGADLSGFGVESMITVNVVTGAYTYTLLDATSAVPLFNLDLDDDGILESVGVNAIYYTVEDGDGDQAAASLSVLVDLNEGPTANDDPSGGNVAAYATNENTDIVINAPNVGLLGNDTDPDQGDTKTVISVNGDTNNVDNTFTFTVADLLVDGVPSGVEVNPLLTVNADGTLTFDTANVDETKTLTFLSDVAGVDYQEVDFDTNEQFDFLNAGEVATITGDYLMGDAEYLVNGDPSVSSAAQFTFTINGKNDAPIAKSFSVTLGEEDNILGVLFDANDLDSEDNQSTLTYVITDDGGYGANFTNNGDGTFNFSTNGDFDFLSQGQPLVINAEYSATDLQGAVTTATFTVTVIGVNDFPMFTSGPDTADITEVVDNAMNEGTEVHMASGTLDFTDVDLNDSHTLTPAVSVVVTGGDGTEKGTFTPTLNQTDNMTGIGSVDWTFSVVDADIEFLSENQTIEQVYTITVDDGQGGAAIQTVTVTITGSNDGPTVDVAAGSASVTEIADNDANEGNLLTDSGSVNFEDIDLEDDHTLQIFEINDPMQTMFFGDFSAKITNLSLGDGMGTVSWDFEVSDADIDFLAQGQPIVQSAVIQISDGIASVDHTVTITITGTNDAPVITSFVDTGSVTELADGAPGENTDDLTAVGTIDFADVDLADSHTTSVTEQGMGYRGTLTAMIADASTGDGAGQVSWTFTVNDADLDDLGPNDSLVQIYNVTVDDGQGGTATQAVTITVNGANDAPTIESQVEMLTEDAVSPDNEASGSVNPMDVDGPLPYVLEVSYNGGTAETIKSNQGGKATVMGMYGELQLMGDGSYLYVLDDTLDDPIAGGVVVNEVFDLVITDDLGASSGGTITIAITGVNDAPVVNGGTGSVIEDDADNTESGTIVITDVDGGTSFSLAIAAGGTTESSMLVADDLMVEGKYGDLTLNITTGDWTYTLDNNDADTSGLAEGEMAQELINFSVNDGFGSVGFSITIDITGANDPPIVGVGVASLTEDNVPNSAALTIPVVDFDNTLASAGFTILLTGTVESLVQDMAGNWSGDGIYGSFTLNQLGEFAYILDNADSDTDALDGGDVAQEVINFSYDDGFGAVASDITITITGANDLPTSADNSVDIDENTISYIFATTAFAFADVDADDISFASIQITSLESVGRLLWNGGDVVLNDVISFADINSGLLSYQIADGAAIGDAYDSFQFSVNDGTADSALSYTQTIDIIAASTDSGSGGTTGPTGTGGDTLDPGGGLIGGGGIGGLPPVILDLNGDNKIHLIDANQSDVTFDYFGQVVQTGWVGPEDGFLVYDADGNGGFSGLNEIMFANYHPDATTDLEGLKLAFDSNHDNVFDSQDSHWLDFGVWQDLDSDGMHDEGEYQSLSNLGMLSIGLISHGDVQEVNGNTIYGFSEYTMADGETGLVADTSLQMITLEQEDVLEPEHHSLSELIASTESSEFIVSTEESPVPVASSFEESQALEQMVQSSQDNHGI